ncbi:MAG: hypothetical protein KF774_02740 [Planctomyces sp.]|nr:hypothetical protein [Planctomyces sp.]
MNTAADPILNDVLVSLHRSLLQYVAEAWPWADAHSVATRDAVLAQSVLQHHTVEQLASLLRDRGYPIQFGTYPDFSHLNYVSLDFLLTRLIADQQRVVADCEAAARELADDPEDGAVLNTVAVAERERLAALRALQQTSRAAAPSRAG